MDRRALPIVLAIVLTLAACAGPGTTPDPTSLPDGESPDGNERPIPADPEDLIVDLRQYASEHADEFGGLYMHPPGSGSFVMLFTDRLEHHASAMADISPRVTVQPARFTEAELLELMESLDLESLRADGVEPLSASLDTIENRVVVELKSNDPTLGPRLELPHGGRLRVVVHPMPGPWDHVEAGDGWRLLAVLDGSGNEAFTVRAATSASELEALWSDLGGQGDPPAVDLDEEVVVSFAHGIGSSCPELRLDGVDMGGGLVTSLTSDPLAPRACTADLVGAVVFVVALERSALPDDGFRLALNEHFGDTVDVPLP